MNQTVTRQILWNVPLAFIVLMYALLGVLLACFLARGVFWWRRVRLGEEDSSRFDKPFLRLWLAVRDGVGQGAVVRETWGWMHYAFYIAFIGLFIGTTIDFINSDVRDVAALLGLNIYFYFGDFYLVFKVAMDTCFLILILGVLAAAVRRILRPRLLSHIPKTKELHNLLRPA